MSLWTFFSGRQEQRSISLGDPVLAAMLGYSSPGTPNVSEHAALTLSAVWRAVSLISGSIGALPMRTLQDGPDGTRKRSASFLDSPGMDRWTPFEWKELVAVYLLLHGAAPLQHIYGGGGQIIGLAPVHPSLVEVEAKADAPGGRLMTVRLANGNKREFTAEDMTYVMGLSLDGVCGVSPITAARMSLGTGLSGDKAAHRMFSNGAMVSGLVTPEDDMSEDEARVIKESVNRTMTGTENAGDIAVINRRLKFQPWTLSAQDAQFLESRTFSIDEVGRWFGLPPHLLGLTEKSTSWGQGIAEQNRGLARYTLTPWTRRIEERLSKLIVSSRKVEFDYTAFVQPSPEDEISLLIEQVNSGLLTLNEARRIRNMPPLPSETGADLPRTPPGAVPPTEADAGVPPSAPGVGLPQDRS